jgi:hypothetical protein
MVVLKATFMRSGTKVMPPNFSENAMAIIMTFTRTNHTSFTIMRLFPLSFHHFQHTFANTEQDAVHQFVKFPALTLEHITKTLFQFVVSAKWQTHSACLTWPNRW